MADGKKKQLVLPPGLMPVTVFWVEGGGDPAPDHVRFACELADASGMGVMVEYGDPSGPGDGSFLFVRPGADAEEAVKDICGPKAACGGKGPATA